MIRFLFISLLLLNGSVSFSQIYEVMITGPGVVKINGSSNVNNFSLNYQKAISGKRRVELGPNQNNKISLTGDTKIALEVNAFSSSHGMITRDFKKMLKSDQFPNINIELSRIIVNKDTPAKNYAIAIITLANTKRLEVLPVNIVRRGTNVFSLNSKHKISLKNYNLEPPKKMIGMISVNDAVVIDITLNAQYKKL